MLTAMVTAMPTLQRPRAALDYSVRSGGPGPVVVSAHGLTSSREMAAWIGLLLNSFCRLNKQ